MSPSPGNLLVRANYLATVICGTMLAVLVAGFSLSPMIGSPTKSWRVIISILLPTIILYVLPGLRAFGRLIAHGTVIAPELVSERPIVSFVVTFVGAFGHFFFLITMAAGIGIALAPEWPEEAKKIAGPMFVALLSYLIALWCGELALVGNGESDQARATRSGPFR
jgi:hypothetical protein